MRKDVGRIRFRCRGGTYTYGALSLRYGGMGRRVGTRARRFGAAVEGHDAKDCELGKTRDARRETGEHPGCSSLVWSAIRLRRLATRCNGLTHEGRALFTVNLTNAGRRKPATARPSVARDTRSSVAKRDPQLTPGRARQAAAAGVRHRGASARPSFGRWGGGLPRRSQF